MLPTLRDLRSSAHVVSLPMATPFRGLTRREALLLEGPRGWSEFSPFVEYGDDEAAAWLEAALDFGWNAEPAPLRGSVRVNATVPAVAAADVPAVLDRFPGCRTAKVKVAEPGGSLADDLARVRAVRDRLGPEGRIRIDANGAWGVDEAERAMRALSPFDLEYAEQPCARVDELAELRRRVRDLAIPIAADESVRKAADPLAVARAGAADILVIKVQPLGGIRRARRVVAAAGLPVVVSSALETSVGLAMSTAFAASLRHDEFDSGLATAALLAGDVVAEPLLPVDGALPVGRVSADSALLARFAAPDDRRRRWLDRLERCHAILERSGE